MLAYIFWHWPAPEISIREYEARLRNFHASLRAEPIKGFSQSASFRLRGAPWIPVPHAYEDWYLVEDFSGIGVLNESSVQGARGGPHDAVASLAASGMGGIYRLIAGTAKPADMRFASWFQKPRGMSYGTLRAEIAVDVGALWQRQMVLGPAPEFCLHSRESNALDPKFSGTVVDLKPAISFE